MSDKEYAVHGRHDYHHELPSMNDHRQLEEARDRIAELEAKLSGSALMKIGERCDELVNQVEHLQEALETARYVERKRITEEIEAHSWLLPGDKDIIIAIVNPEGE